MSKELRDAARAVVDRMTVERKTGPNGPGEQAYTVEYWVDVGDYNALRAALAAVERDLKGETDEGE